MSSILILDNYGASNKLEITYLVEAAAKNATQVRIKNQQNVDKDWYYLLIGTLGLENAEIRGIDSLSNDLITLSSGLSREHPVNENVTVLLANKMQVWRGAANPDGTRPGIGTFTPLGDPIDIDYDNLETRFTDATGSADYYYGYTYLNTKSGSSTNLAESQIIRGGRVNDYTSIARVRDAAGFGRTRTISDAQVDVHRVAAQSYIDGRLSGRFRVPFTSPINAYIERITTMIAAGYLQIDQYGTYTVHDSNNGQDKLDWAEAQIDKIVDGTLVITNPDGTTPEPPTNSDGTSTDFGFSGWPNETTASLPIGDPGSGDFMFRRADIDGYNERQY